MCESSDALLRSRLKTNVRGNRSCDELESAAVSNLGNPADQVAQISSCSVCSSTFSSYDDLLKHSADRHSDSESFYCNACNVCCVSLSRFKTHVDLEHRYKCDRCDGVFKHRESFLDHAEIHSTSGTECRFCKKPFNKTLEMKRHELRHMEKTCRFCGKETESQTHLETCSRSYLCLFCKSSFRLKKDLVAHVNETHDRPISKCSRCRTVLEPKEESGPEEESFCKICRSDSAESRTSDCSADGDLPPTCRFCSKSFALKSSLRRHEKSHSGFKPYQCKFCPKKFKDNSTCIVHTRTHTGEHPFRCEECQKNFKQLANLKMHTYRHHKKNESDTLDSQSSEDYRSTEGSPEFEKTLHFFVSQRDN